HDAVNTGQIFASGAACGSAPASELNFTAMPTGCYLSGQVFTIEVCATDSFGNVDLTYGGNVTLSKASGSGNLAGTLTQTAISGRATFSGLTLDAADTYTFSATDGSMNAGSPRAYINTQCTTCPSMTGAFIDACGSDEGRNEILMFNSNDFAIPVEASAVALNYGTGAIPATNYTSQFTTNAKYIDSLNSLAGCALFVDALSNSPIPPNTMFLMMHYSPTYNYDFNSLCGSGPIYLMFSMDSDWNTTGNFKNCTDCGVAESGTNPRFFRGNFSTLNAGATCDFTYEYTPCDTLTCMGNGDGLTFSYGGGLPVANWNQCVPLAPLPVQYGQPLTAEAFADRVELRWATLGEQQNRGFVIERSADAGHGFAEIGSVPGYGNSGEMRSYGYMDLEPMAGISWYRLRQEDMNGNTQLTNAVQVNRTSAGDVVQSWYDADGEVVAFSIEGNGQAKVQLFDMGGRNVMTRDLGEVQGRGRFELPVNAVANGVLLYEIRLDAQVFRGKIARW
ncbi:MAG: hypothetical protein AAF570_17285, partial [Bacteroidota bacterium]